jgi:hypothetical protein
MLEEVTGTKGPWPPLAGMILNLCVVAYLMIAMMSAVVVGVTTAYGRETPDNDQRGIAESVFEEAAGTTTTQVLGSANWISGAAIMDKDKQS